MVCAHDLPPCQFSWSGGPPGRQLFRKIHSQPPNEHNTRYATPQTSPDGLDQPRKPLPLTRLIFLNFDEVQPYLKERIAADADSPEAAYLQKDLIRFAQAAVEDPKDFEVLRLHYAEEVPIVSTDENVEDLERRTGESANRIKYRVK